jgi:arylsulfatase A-like enzyme
MPATFRVLASLLGLLATALAAAQRAPAQGAERPPNVVLILTDDQGTVDLGVCGTADVRTPSMDRIARAGVRFTQFYAGAPVCSPSRAALLTGRSPQAAGVPGNVSPRPGAESGLPPEQVTIAELLQRAGYATALVGKWHLGHDPERQPGAQGFDHWFGHLVGCIDNWSHFFYWDQANRHDLWRNGEPVDEAGSYFPDLMLREATAFVRQNRERPFFLYFAANAPHYPYQGEAEVLADYRERGVPYPRDLYGAFLTSLDARIGALLDELDALELTEHTILVLQSDHGHSTEIRAHGGGGSAGPYRGAKFSLFEGGIRVPAVIAWPGHLPADETRSQVATATDWLPTLLELCQLPPVEHAIAGRSLVPILRDADTPSPHDALHWQRGDRWAVRRGPWKLLHRPLDTSEAGPGHEVPEDNFLVQLFDDPGEKTNVADRNPAIVYELRELHDRWVRGGY